MGAQSPGLCPRHQLGREQFEVTKVIRHPFGKRGINLVALQIPSTS